MLLFLNFVNYYRQAAISRQQNSRSANQEDLKNRIQPGMSEDEALARALQASMVQNDTTQPTSNIKKCAISWLNFKHSFGILTLF